MKPILITMLVVVLLGFTGCATKTPTIDEVTITLVPLFLMGIGAYALGYSHGRKS